MEFGTLNPVAVLQILPAILGYLLTKGAGRKLAAVSIVYSLAFGRARTEFHEIMAGRMAGSMNLMRIHDFVRR